MPFPKFDSCTVCEEIRPELGSKLQILGFYGLAPNVEVLTAKMGQPFPVAFIAGFPAISSHEVKLFQHSFVLSDSSGKVLVETPQSPLNVEPNMRVVIAVNATVIPTIAGQHTVKILIDSEVALETTFVIRLATAEELKKAGLSPIQ